MEQGSFFFLQRHGIGLRLARPSLPTGDTCNHDVTLHIPTSARSHGIPHTELRAPFAQHSCREVRADDVTSAPNLRGFPCRPARVHRPGNPLRVFREQNTRYAAHDALYPRPRGNPCGPNSPNTRRHFNRPRDGLSRNAGRSHAEIPLRRRARDGRSRNAERASYAASCETGAVTEITLRGLLSSPFPSPVWIRPFTNFMHALTHPISLTLYARFTTHFDTLIPFTTHTGTITFRTPLIRPVNFSTEAEGPNRTPEHQCCRAGYRLRARPLVGAAESARPIIRNLDRTFSEKYRSLIGP